MPFTVAGIYEYATVNGEPVVSMSMLTINADMHPFMRQFHAPDDEKRSIVVIPKGHRKDWLTCNHVQARVFLVDMPPDEYTAAPKEQIKNIY